ncbi:SirB2 family protein [Microbulbifer rhizosphaerae]|uniref:Putative membrane protein SirB2 n=1 Tax=Microbulbifer rhizosphaerae TaxID=1562603 RepID=A0A7W4Z9Q8_9GAMM|nr:SirB2 family protein [Microbulbifer rhizosphaerae]MBB3061947.1 putative membrane protein SirB2 [Microbulbifer rhizosphaerae]
MDYSLIKTLHISFATLSLVGFLLRGAWMFANSRLLYHRATRVLPHCIDAVLIASALTLATLSGQWPLQQPWLSAKVTALLCYVALGWLALRSGYYKPLRAGAWLAGLAVFTYIVSVASSRNPLPF